MVTTNTTNYGLIRTVQVRNENIPGVLGALASAIGSAGANIGNIQTVHLSDVVISTAGVPGLIAPEAVRSGQIVFALSNPDPEIRPAQAVEAGAALAADGTTVNNLLGYPGIWRGALSTQAGEINRSMLIAAGEALMGVTPHGDLSPSALDPEVHRRVAYAVGKAAVESDVGDADGLVDLE